MQFIDLKAQYAALKGEIDANIQDVLNSAAFIGGKYVKELETQLAAFTGRKHCITCANGTDALQLAFMALGVGEGDAVFAPDKMCIRDRYFTAGNILHAHLLGSSKKMLELNAGGLLEAAAAKWGKEHGFRYIHHGGGRSSDPNDALFQYKKKFGKNTEFDFYIGKKIWNKDVYDMLVEMCIRDRNSRCLRVLL